MINAASKVLAIVALCFCGGKSISCHGTKGVATFQNVRKEGKNCLRLHIQLIYAPWLPEMLYEKP